MRVCAVSYLNTVPLVWGMERGPQTGCFDLSYSVPSVCADRLEKGEVEIGIVPCAEIDRLGLDFFPDVGIACRGEVRSILLVSRVPVRQIRKVAADISSRTSAMLTRIVLAERYGVTPEFTTMAPNLRAMLDVADAALVIGDPALALQPDSLPFQVLDLGAEWLALTGLPMVFAVWAGKAQFLTDESRRIFQASCEYGTRRIEEIAADREASRGFSPDVVREYLTRYIHFELGPEELRGLAAYRRYLAAFRPALVP